MSACNHLGLPYHTGITWSIDGFYGENRRTDGRGNLGGVSHGGYVLPSRRDRMLDAARMGVLNCEMEAGTILTLCNLFGLRGGCICTVSDRVPWSDGEAAALDFDRAIDGCIRAALNAVELLSRWEEERRRSGLQEWSPASP